MFYRRGLIKIERVEQTVGKNLKFQKRELREGENSLIIPKRSGKNQKWEFRNFKIQHNLKKFYKNES